MLRTARVTAVLLLAAAAVSPETQVDRPLTDPAADGRELLWPAPDASPPTVGFCVVNVGIASVFAGKAAIFTNLAVKLCPEIKTTNEKLACSASITGVLLGFSYMAAFSAAAAADCMASMTTLDHKAVHRAACAADSSAMIAAFNLISTAGTGVYATCVEGDVGFDIGAVLAFGNAARRLNDQSKGLQPEQRHMFAELGKNFTQMHQKLDVAERRLQAKKGKLPKPIAAMKKAIKKAETAVTGREDKEERPVAQTDSEKLYEGGNKQQARCTAEITRLILSLGVVGAGIANAVVDCPEMLGNVKAQCAGAILLLIAGVMDIIAAGASFTNTCAPLSDLRRLSGANESSLSEHLV